MHLKSAALAHRLLAAHRPRPRVELFAATPQDGLTEAGVFDERRRRSAARRRLKSHVVAQDRELKQRQMERIMDRILADLDCPEGAGRAR